MRIVARADRTGAESAHRCRTKNCSSSPTSQLRFSGQGPQTNELLKAMSTSLSTCSLANDLLTAALRPLNSSLVKKMPNFRFPENLEKISQPSHADEVASGQKTTDV